MSLRFYNSLTKQVEDFKAYDETNVQIYTCGPTVYDKAHIGNLSAFIIADVLRRVVQLHGYRTKHVMNFTDIDDKTIARSQKLYPDKEPMAALKYLTQQCGEQFIADMQAVGNNTDELIFIKAADQETIKAMQQLISELVQQDFAYLTDDGIYFDISAYKNSGKTYGQLVTVTAASTSNERISNDEYDKESAHDFALWKKQKSGEPAWDFTIADQDMTGRPGWHVECSTMSRLLLGQPFDIHTGGIDLKFPHHENEIAQSTATTNDSTYAKYFIHSEHILVDGKKMSKSLNNFYTLADLVDKNYSAQAFRMLVLQSHYRNPTNLSFDGLTAATNRLANWRNLAELRHQINDTLTSDDAKRANHSSLDLKRTESEIKAVLSDDINTPLALSLVDSQIDQIKSSNQTLSKNSLVDFIKFIENFTGLDLLKNTPDIDDQAKQLILRRQRAREAKDYEQADKLRNQLDKLGIALLDKDGYSLWLSN